MIDCGNYERTPWGSVVDAAIAGDAEAQHRLRGYAGYLDCQFGELGYRGVLNRPESFSSDEDEAEQHWDEEMCEL